MPGVRQFQSSVRHGVGFGTCVLATVLGTLFLALAAPPSAASAAAWGPHHPELSANTSANSERSHTVAALSEVNLVITDLATGNATVLSSGDVTPNYNYSCNSTTTTLCLQTASGTLGFEVQGPSLKAGQVYDEGSADLSVATVAHSCSTLSDSSVSASVELDQY